MSHKATNWLASVRGIKSGEFQVLFHLCDCHNPSHGCFPSQEYLMDNTEMSNGAINNNLNRLEEKGLIRREKRHHEGSHKRLSTRYMLGFEIDEAQEPSPECGDGAISSFDAKPSPVFGQSHLQNVETKEVIEPVIEPTPNPQAGLGAEVGGFEKVWKAWPLKQLPKRQDAARAIFKKLSVEHQALAVKHAPDHIIRSAMLHKAPLIINYLKQSLFLELHDAPPLDEGGLFKITPDRPEWREWMGWARSKRGQQGVDYFVQIGSIATETRLPATQENAA